MPTKISSVGNPAILRLDPGELSCGDWILKTLFQADKTVTDATARNCFLINQFATPGLGSLMAGRWFSGIPQILLALAGCGLVVAWVALTLRESYKLMDFSAEPVSYAWLGETGGVIFAVSWIWALITSIQIFREAKTRPPALPPELPKS
jgi:hypothetical protein